MPHPDTRPGTHRGAAHGAPPPARPRPPYNPLQREARRYVDAQFLPLLAQINREFGARARTGQAAIAGSTEALAGHLAPLAGQTHDIYAKAQGSQEAVNAALANRLTGAGASLGSEIGGKLAQAGITGVPNDAAATGAGAANAGYGIGSAALSSLIGQGAAAETRMAGLPGIARLGGAQESRRFGAQLESERASAVGDIRAKIPGTLAQILQDLKNRAFQEKALQVGFQGDILTANARAASTAETARGHDLTYKGKMEAIRAANARSGQTLAERAKYHNRSLEQQAAADAERSRKNRMSEKQRRRQQWWREHGGKPKGGKGGGKQAPGLRGR